MNMPQTSANHDLLDKQKPEAIPPSSSTVCCPDTPRELCDRYEFIQKIGNGSQGVVYFAKRKSDGLEVAIKHLRINSVNSWKEYELFHREALVLKDLNIDGVARFYEAPEYLDIPEPSAYIVQEYIHGESIDAMLKRGYRFTLPNVFRLTIRLLDILSNLHKHNPPIVHRDLKPSNVLMKPQPDGDFLPYVIDFGAVANPQIKEGGSTVAGTFGYMAPEQLMGKPVPASDIYSLAAMLAYILSGTEPSDMQVTDFHLVIDPHLENIPNAVVATLHQMLEPNAERRLSDCDALKERFQQLLDGKFLSESGTNAPFSEDRLQKVKMLGQAGNLDIWMSLTEQTPRNPLRCYNNLSPRFGIQKKSIYVKLRKSLRKYFLSSIFVFFMSGCVFALMVALFTCVPAFFVDKPFSLLNALGLPIIIGLIIWLIMMVFATHILIKLYGEYQYRYSVPKSDGNNKMYKADVMTLIQSGSKTIATVTDVKYVPTDDAMNEVFHALKDLNANIRESIGSNYQPDKDDCRCYCHDCPRYRIRYKFNPPDDDNPQDLVHEIFVHQDMGAKLRSGDPLPILYYISPQNHLDVMSMPFPFPMDDFVSWREMYYRKS